MGAVLAATVGGRERDNCCNALRKEEVHHRGVGVLVELGILQIIGRLPLKKLW